MWRRPAGTSIVPALGQRAFRRLRRPDACIPLQTLLPVIAALCVKQWPNPTALAPALASDGLNFDRLGTSNFSTREAEVVRLMRKGHSTKSMARLPGNSPETLKVHRKRIYSKLSISSQGELFSRFLGAQDWVPMGEDFGVQMGFVN